MDLAGIYFPSAVTLGALHALEPGHAKTLTAAYLIGTKGTKRDAILLGMSVAFTHSIVVVGLSLAAVLIGREAFTDEASYFIAISSSILVIILGAWLLRKRLRTRNKANSLDHNHSHNQEPIAFEDNGINGTIAISETPNGERFKIQLNSSGGLSEATIRIFRESNNVETYDLIRSDFDPSIYFSASTPEEPHEFRARLEAKVFDKIVGIDFTMTEPHHHDHSLLSDDEHAKAHAADLPDYVRNGERPSYLQIMAFGAAGGLVPCPAAISVMLLSLSLGNVGNGLFLVLGFSLGLAITLVGVGLLIVTGITKLASGGKMSRFSSMAPSIAAGMVILSGVFGLIVSINRH